MYYYIVITRWYSRVDNIWVLKIVWIQTSYSFLLDINKFFNSNQFKTIYFITDGFEPDLPGTNFKFLWTNRQLSAIMVGSINNIMSTILAMTSTNISPLLNCSSWNNSEGFLQYSTWWDWPLPLGNTKPVPPHEILHILQILSWWINWVASIHHYFHEGPSKDNIDSKAWGM